MRFLISVIMLSISFYALADGGHGLCRTTKEHMPADQKNIRYISSCIYAYSNIANGRDIPLGFYCSKHLLPKFGLPSYEFDKYNGPFERFESKEQCEQAYNKIVFALSNQSIDKVTVKRGPLKQCYLCG